MIAVPTAAKEPQFGKPPVLSINSLVKHFATGRKLAKSGPRVRAVDGLSFDIAKGETLGVVGESGCGKSTLARLVMQIVEPDAGELLFNGELVGGRLLPPSLYRPQVQMVFQDSYASLNPRLTVEDSIAFGPRAHGVSRRAATTLCHELLRSVGLEPARFAHRYPHELSGGQRQRVNIARALALRPKLLILDEAVSALDKSIEAQVLNLLVDLKSQFDLTYMFISHDLNVVRFMSDRVAVMYLGKIIEIGDAATILRAPRHPYTVGLLSSMPSADPDLRTEEAPLLGDPPNPINPPSGCRFHTRCKFASDLCKAQEPPLFMLTDGHQVACHMSIPGAAHPLEVAA